MVYQSLRPRYDYGNDVSLLAVTARAPIRLSLLLVCVQHGWDALAQMPFARTENTTNVIGLMGPVKINQTFAMQSVG